MFSETYKCLSSFPSFWLKRKEYEQNTDSDTKEQLKYNTETESDDDDDDGDDDDAKAFYRKHWPEMDNQTAFYPVVTGQEREATGKVEKQKQPQRYNLLLNSMGLIS